MMQDNDQRDRYGYPYLSLMQDYFIVNISFLGLPWMPSKIPFIAYPITTTLEFEIISFKSFAFTCFNHFDY